MSNPVARIRTAVISATLSADVVFAELVSTEVGLASIALAEASFGIQSFRLTCIDYQLGFNLFR